MRGNSVHASLAGFQQDSLAHSTKRNSLSSCIISIFQFYMNCWLRNISLQRCFQSTDGLFNNVEERAFLGGSIFSLVLAPGLAAFRCAGAPS